MLLAVEEGARIGVVGFRGQGLGVSRGDLPVFAETKNESCPTMISINR